MKSGIKEFKEKEIMNFLETCVSKLKEYGIKTGQVRMQIEDGDFSWYTSKNVITEVEPAIISTGAGILLCAKKDF